MGTTTTPIETKILHQEFKNYTEELKFFYIPNNNQKKKKIKHQTQSLKQQKVSINLMIMMTMILMHVTIKSKQIFNDSYYR